MRLRGTTSIVHCGVATAAQRRIGRTARRKVSIRSSITSQPPDDAADRRQPVFLTLVFGAAAVSVATRLGGLRSDDFAAAAAFAGAASAGVAPPLPRLARNASIRSITCAP